MPNTPWQRLTREELIAFISDHYKFLTKFCIPSEVLKFPPLEGWPNITPEATQHFPRSPIVIDLLKHLPYIDEKYSRNMVINVNYQSDVVDYSTVEPGEWDHKVFQCGAETIEEWIEEMKESKKTMMSATARKKKTYEDIKLENMIVLANGYESEGRTLVLDMFKGSIYEDVCRCGMISEVRVEDFFQELKTKFEELKYVPVPGGYKWPGRSTVEGELHIDVLDVDEFDESLVEGDPEQQYKKIFRNFGWPGEEVVAAIQAHHPHRADAEEEESL